MGHDITIGNCQETYISFNWSCMRDIFHIEEIHGHNNKDGRISRRLTEALNVLKDKGYEPNNNMRVDGWGQWKDGAVIEPKVGMNVRFRTPYTYDGMTYYVGRIESIKADIINLTPYTTEKFGDDEITAPAVVLPFTYATDMTSPDCCCMFAYILSELLELAQDYPTCTWWSDQVLYTQPLYGVDAEKVKESDDDDGSYEDHYWKSQKKKDTARDCRYVEEAKKQRWADLSVKEETKSWADVVRNKKQPEPKKVRDGPVKFLPDGLHGIRQGNGYIIPIRDGLRTEVSTYAHAMELHLKSHSLGDDLRAKAWFEVAVQLSDAPAIFHGWKN